MDVVRAVVYYQNCRPCGVCDLKRKLPKETKNHVPLIQASIILARNPEKYGLPKELDAPLSYDLVSVSKPVDLKAVAKIFGITLEELKQLNPSLRRTSTPPNYPEFQLKVPAGSDAELLQKVAELPPVKVKAVAATGNRYKVQPGDTLSSIAQRYRITLAALQNANAGVSAKALRAGSWIQLPKTAGSQRSTVTSKAASSGARASATKASVTSKTSAAQRSTSVAQSKSQSSGKITAAENKANKK